MGVKTLSEFKGALQQISCPHISLVYSTPRDIGYQSVGKIPLRSFKTNRILPGWDARFEWKGVIPFSEMIHSENPGKGYIVAANNNPGDLGYKHRLSYG